MDSISKKFAPNRTPEVGLVSVRLQRFDIHYLTPDLRIIPFCSFNVIPEWYRDKIQQKYGLPIEA